LIIEGRSAYRDRHSSLHLYIHRRRHFARARLAIYHLTVAVVSRARGQRIAASAAAQSATKLRDDYYGVTHNGTRKIGVELSEIRAPADAPRWVYDRALLWNRVEAAERRKDAQLARVVEISLPVELTPTQSVELLREYVDAEFVSKGMIADIAIRRASPDRPNAHVLLTLREPDAEGFGPKVRLWNRKTNLLEWRSAWARCANAHLARAGHRVRIDHRTLEAQQIELAPARKTGAAPRSEGERMLPQYMQDRRAEQREIARENGDAILQDPSLAIRALTRQRSIFTREDLIRFLTPRTGDAAQLEAALSSIMSCTELVAVGPSGGDPALFSSRDLIEAERSLMRRAQAMVARRGHAAFSGAPDSGQSLALLRDAFVHVIGEGDFKAIALPNGKSEFLNAARAAWNAHGFRVRVTLPLQDEEPLGKDDVLVIMDAEMIELKALERLLAAADRARAKVVLVGDSAQLAAMGSISPMQSLYEAFGSNGRG
jgi:ATP-dependent exoDNAse (exonuclease V) alpha subunit